MTPELKDRTGAPVTIRLDESRPISAYTVHLADGTLAGRADFIDAPEADGERIFFHTEVEQEFSGRGLGGLLVREALADSIRKDLIVVPVCPLFAAHLRRHGAQFQADGGRFRQPVRADIALATRAATRGA
jgi:predicted GNAT family acetyltransferase